MKNLEIKINHIAYVVENIDTYLKKNVFFLNFAEISKIMINKIQKVRQCFIIFFDSPSIEILEPLNETSPLYSFLKKGGGFHHICYETQDILETIQYFKKLNAVNLCEPYDDIAFLNAKIAFVYYQNSVIELIQYNKENTNE
ncbi:MAG TPA: VOC family protein [bacterium]|nr:VOC family protein [bacterium]